MKTRHDNIHHPTQISYMDISPFPKITQAGDIDTSILEKENRAKSICEHIKHAIADFELSLSCNEEIGLKILALQNDVAYYIQSIGFLEDYILVFHCKDAITHKDVTLMQHITQLNILLLKLPKIEEERQAHRLIGFGQE